MKNANEFTYAVDFDGDPKELTYTFGGTEALAEVAVPALLSTSTLDAFAGRLSSVGTLHSNADMKGDLNPQTGPSSFHRHIPVIPWQCISRLSSRASISESAR